MGQRWGEKEKTSRQKVLGGPVKAPFQPLLGLAVHSTGLISSSTVLTTSPTQLTAGHPRADPAHG